MTSLLSRLGLMAVLSALTQVVNLVLVGIQSRIFGADSGYDAFVLARNFVALALSFIATAVPVVLVPAFTQRRDQRAIGVFISVLVMGGMVLAIGLGFLGPSLLASAGIDSSVVRASRAIIPLVLIWQFIMVGIAVVSAYLNATERFGWQQGALACSGLCVLLITFLRRPTSTVEFVAYYIGVTFPIFCGLALLARHHGMRAPLTWNIRSPEAWGMIRLLVPAVLSSSAYEVSILVDSALAGRTGVGGATYLYYSSAIANAAQAILMSNINTVAYTNIAASSSHDARVGSFFRFLKVSFAAACMILACYIAVGRQAIEMLLGAHSFSDDGQTVIYVAGFCMLASSVPGTVRQLVYSLYNSIGDTRTPFINSILATVINISCSVVLVTRFGVVGVAAGTLVGAIASAGMAVARAYRRFRPRCQVAWHCAVFCLVVLVVSSSFGYLARSVVSASKLGPFVGAFSGLMILCVSSVLFVGVYRLWVRIR